MGCADCIGQNRAAGGYIFAMRNRGRILSCVLLSAAVLVVRAEPGDIAGAHDYPHFPRVPGFVITDFDEDNPAEFNFPVARPLPVDSGHVEMVPVRGHRYVIRYERGSGRAPTLLEAQKYYEKLAADAGFTAEKTGAVGDVTETFRKKTAGHEIWVYLEPAITENVVTVVESDGKVAAPAEAAPAPFLAMNGGGEAVPSPTEPPISVAPPEKPAPVSAPADATEDDSLFNDLTQQGRVVFPIIFSSGKSEITTSSQPQVDRIAAMMEAHPEVFLRIEGHTDNSGDADENLRLSALRAFAVRDKLIAAHIDKSRLDAVGVGGLQPIADNLTAEGREKNRRIELVLRRKSGSFHSVAPNGQNYYPGAKKA
jgi:outer membrane protein OmpA-like peptidoglycan-associated protein